MRMMVSGKTRSPIPTCRRPAHPRGARPEPEHLRGARLRRDRQKNHGDAYPAHRGTVVYHRRMTSRVAICAWFVVVVVVVVVGAAACGEGGGAAQKPDAR